MRPCPQARWVILVLAAVALCAGAFLWMRWRRSRGSPPAVQARGDTAVLNANQPPARVAAAGALPVEAPADAAIRYELQPFVAFTDWLTEMRRGGAVDRTEGVRLATARRAALKQLIIADPRAALSCAVPRGIRAELPRDVVALLETPVDATANFDVVAVCFGPEDRTERIVTVGDRRYRAHVYGRRLATLSKAALPVHGIAIDGELAVSELPYRRLEPTERRDAGLAAAAVAVAVGVSTRTFASEDELSAWADRVAAAEAAPDPEALSHPALSADTAAWVVGDKTVLWLKVEFPDDRGTPATDDMIAASMAEVNAFYGDVSRVRTGFGTVLFPETIVLPNPKSYYAAQEFTAISDYALGIARTYDAAHANAGTYNPDTCDRWIVIFKSVPAYLWSGLGGIGAKGLWLNGDASSYTVAHELGHNQGLLHSHSWVPQSSNPIGAGNHVEYGDVFDVMGCGVPPFGHFNAKQKETLTYLDDAEIAAVTRSGVYRLYRSDDRAASGVQALQISAGNAYDYWVEFRQQDPGPYYDRERLRGGVLLHWGKHPGFASGDGTYLLDLAPGTGMGMYDAPLGSGERFVDPDYGITITPGATGGTAPAQWIDVRVDFGASGSNRNPVLALTAPVTAAARSPVTFTATATDPDGDPVNCRWDFGNGDTCTGSGAITYCWLTGGTYTVSCTAMDGRGGIHTQTAQVAVEDPLMVWTNRVPDLQNGLRGVVFAGDQFVAVGGAGSVLTSPDGISWNRSSAASNHFYKGIASSGTTYVAVGDRSVGTGWGAAMARSDDAVTWTDVSPAAGDELFNVTYGGGRFVAVGRGGLAMKSVDGLSWTIVTSNTSQDLYAVTYAGGRYVAVGANGAIITSTDATEWTNRSVVSSAVFYGVVCPAGQWLISSGQQSWVSSDGLNWVAVPGVKGGECLFSLFTSKIGNALVGSAWGGRVYLSDTGTVWARARSADGGDPGVLWGTAEGNGVVVVVGEHGIVQSGTPRLRALNPPMPLTAGRQATMTVAPGIFAKVELIVDGSVVSQTSLATGVLSWTPTRFGAHAVVLRGTHKDGSTECIRQTLTAGLPDWTWENPRPGANRLTAAAYALRRWWVGDQVGALFTSVDGKTWTPVRPPFGGHRNLRAITGTDTRLLIATDAFDGSGGFGPGLWSTTDGTTWTAGAGIGTTSITAVAFGATQWTAIGYGQAFTSTDGVNWTEHPFPANGTFGSVGYGNGRWVAVGAGIMTSADGANWSAASCVLPPNDSLARVAYANGRWVALSFNGQVLTSNDGVEWTSVAARVGSLERALGVWSDQFVVAGNEGLVFTSADGETWTAQRNSRRANIYDMAVQGEQIVMVGDGAEIDFGTAPGALQCCGSEPHVGANALVADGNRVLLATSNTDFSAGTATAPTAEFRLGTRWQPTRYTPATSAQAYGIARFDGQFIAVCSYGQIFTSPNGTDWLPQTSGVGEQLYAVAGGGGTAVVVGRSGLILSSTDGANWVVRATGVSEALRGIAYGDGQFIAVGDNGVVLQSVDGVRWVQRSSGTAMNLFAIAWSPTSGFVAVGFGDSILRSADGAAWSRVPAPNGNGYTTVAATPFGFMAGSLTSDDACVSADGKTWLRTTTPLAVINALAADAQNLWAAGDDGALVRHAMTIAPIFQTQPASQAASWGDSVTLSGAATGAGALTYQWYFDDKPVEGATSAQYAIAWVTPAEAGAYRLVATDMNGVSATSDAVAVAVAGAAPRASRLANLSVRTNLREGQPLMVGFSASAPRPILVRAVGPTLDLFGVPSPCADPALELYSGGTVLAANEDWDPALGGTFDRLGAFPLRAASKDAALLQNITGSVSAMIRARGAGAVLVELYDAGRGFRPKLVNVSARNRIGAGDDVLIAGFVVDTNASAKLLIRGVGPQLTSYGVADALPDPVIEVRDQSHTLMAANDDWSTDAAAIAPLQAAFTATNAFPLDVGGKDAALLVSLPSGLYTVQLSGAHGATGEGLIEVYELP